ncbi:HXXXD-type acyl-transferase family protein [Rhynchospora pubera]|uniref:HXXXD-type acyl-transferase family protein n=1 Tax=Rhynchospora pubera TaxID=906938 RepID=A0AAV8F154_9POAL|nr:HXXXD-type acyl-transferase family protein [Rhynchospora pubera]
MLHSIIHKQRITKSSISQTLIIAFISFFLHLISSSETKQQPTMKSILRQKISFNVQRSKPVVIFPAKPTPHDIKFLSDIDNQTVLRYYTSGVHFYHAEPSKAYEVDPAHVIKAALAKALVYYYPITGRLKEQPEGKLVLDCTGEGAMFVEAEADVCLEYLGDPLTPPFPFTDQLHFDSMLMGPGVINQPLLYLQVTRFKCGGFTFAHKTCHVIADAHGWAQFLTAIGEFARGADQPNVLPVWDRHLLLARDPPAPAHIHLEYEPMEDATQEDFHILLKPPVPANLVQRSFLFGPKDISVLKEHVKSLESMSYVSRFELITAAVWRSHTIALDYNPDYEIRVLFPVSSRGTMVPPLPTGFYGNAFARAVACSKSGKLCSNPLGYALTLVKEAKEKARASDFLQSLADLTVLRGRPQMMDARTFLVTDVTRAGFQGVDFGWGGGMFGGKALPIATMYTSFRNNDGEEVVVVPMCLPELAMATFKTEMESLIQA